MTRSLIRLGNTVRASFTNDCITNSHNDRRSRDRTETDSDIARGYDSITRSYRREREGVGTNTNNDDITRGYN